MDQPTMNLGNLCGGDQPQFALFEADGGAWKLEAVENIARKLSAGLTSATVVS